MHRLAKLDLQLRAGISPERTRQELTRTLAAVDAAFHGFAAASTGRGRRIAERANAKWEAYRDLIRSTPQDGSLIHLGSEDLDNTLSALVQAVDGDNAGPLAPFVALSLRQSMLSQRIAKLYLLRSLGDRSRGIEVDIAQTRLEFRAAFAELMRAPETAQGIQAELELARVQWIFFDTALEDTGNTSRAYRTNVATTSERITQVMDEVVNRLLRSQTL